MKVPMIVCLNQYDILTKQGYEIDIQKLSDVLGVPVVPSIAIHNRGVHEILEKIIEIYENRVKISSPKFQFGKEIESKVRKLTATFSNNFPDHKCPARFAALKLLENDEKCISNLELEGNNGNEVLNLARETRNQLEELHGEDISTIVNAESCKHRENFEKSEMVPNGRSYYPPSGVGIFDLNSCPFWSLFSRI